MKHFPKATLETGEGNSKRSRIGLQKLLVTVNLHLGSVPDCVPDLDIVTLTSRCFVCSF